MELAIHQHFAVGSVKDAILAGLSSLKEASLWMGRKVITIVGIAWDVSKAALLLLIEGIAVVWRELSPYLAKIALFLASKPGIFGMGILASAVLIRMALNDDNLTDPTGRRALAAIGAMVLFFTGVYGGQANFAFIPQFV